jgi:hypothetical protein
MIADSFEMLWVRVLAINFLRAVDISKVKEPFNQKQVTATYKSLIGQRMPDANHYLLLYVLDLLSSFAKKCDKNLMTATRTFFHSQIQLILKKLPTGLADIFCPSLISHPQHEMLPKEHSLNQNVLEFLLAQWDSWFMLNV